MKNAVRAALATAVLAAALLVGSFSPAQAEFGSPLLNTVASAFASRPVTVVCKSAEEDPILDGAWGYVWQPTGTATHTTLLDRACIGALAIAVDVAEVSDYYKAIGAATIVHEAYHLKRVPNNQSEAITECRAFRHFDIVLIKLGATPAVLDRLMPIMLIDHYALGAHYPDYFRPSCRMPKRYYRWYGNYDPDTT